MLVSLEQRLHSALRRRLEGRRHALAAEGAKLGALSPLRVLERGYSVTRRADGSLVTSTAQLAVGDKIVVTLREGEARGQVEELLQPGRQGERPK